MYGRLFWKESGCLKTMKKTYQHSSWLWKISIILPAVLLLCVILQFSVNVPWFDDFDPFPDFLNQWTHAKGATEHLSLILKPNNEHRMVFGKLATLLIYWTTATLNFTYLHLIGFVFILGTWGLFFKVFKENGLSNKVFLPVSWFLFQWQFQMVFLWAICSLQHPPVVFFLCLSMYLLANTRFVYAVLFGFCATFSMSNGIFVWVAGTAVLIYQRAFLKATLWLMFGTVAITAYFYGLTTMGNEQSFAYLQKHPDETFFGFFAFLGGLFDFFPDRPIDFRVKLPILGGMLLGGLVFLWLWKIGKNWLLTFNKKGKGDVTFLQDTKNTLIPFLLGILTFLLSNAAVIALLRPRFGFLVMVVSNYKLYPALYMMVIYSAFIGLVSTQWRSIVWKVGMGLSIGIWLLSTLHYGPMMVERRKDFYVNAFNQQHNGFGLGHQPNSAEAKYVTLLMNKLTESKIYAYPSKFATFFEQMKTVSQTTKIDLDVKVERHFKGNFLYMAIPHSPTYGLNDGVYAFFRSSEKLYVFRMKQKLYDGRNVLKRYDNTVSLDLPLSTLLPSSYYLGFMIIEGTKTKVGIYQSINVEPNGQ